FMLRGIGIPSGVFTYSVFITRILEIGYRMCILAGIVIPDVCSGTSRNDVMTGDGNDNFICGRSGYDKMILGGGSDTGVGNGGLAGGDVIDGGYGKDTIIGNNINAPGAPEDC